MQEKKFDKNKYDYNYRLSHYKEFRCYLSIEEYDVLCNLLKQKNITKSDFVRTALKKLQEK